MSNRANTEEQQRQQFTLFEDKFRFVQKNAFLSQSRARQTRLNGIVEIKNKEFINLVYACIIFNIMSHYTMLDTFCFKGFALCSIITLATPLDVLKMRMQINTELLSLGRISEQYRSFRNCLSTILKNQGLVGLWKGNTVSMARVLPIEAINYYTRKTLQQYFSNKLANNILISIISGITASTILYPTDILRQFLNNSTSGRLTFFAATQTILAQYGYKYFYKGYPNILAITILYRSCYNGFYDTHKLNASNLKDRVWVAYLSTIAAEYVVYPIQTIRRRRIIMNAKEGFFTYGKNIWKKERVKGFYKGATVVPIQSIAWALVLILFDTAGMGFQISFQG